MLARFLALLLARVDPAEITYVRVFGSRARGLSHENSELDVAVEAAAGADRIAVRDAAADAAWDAMDQLDMHGLRLSAVALPHAAGEKRWGVYAAGDREGIQSWPPT